MLTFTGTRRLVSCLGLASLMGAPLALGACSGGSQPAGGQAAAGVLPADGQASRHPDRVFRRPVSDANTKLVFVSNTVSAVVDAFNPANGQIMYQITDGMAEPYGLAVDQAGNLYVANTAGADVTVFAPGTTTRMATLADTGQQPVNVAVRGDGTVYVANIGGSVNVYRPGQTSPAYSLTNSNLLRVYGVALNANGVLYVSGRDAGSFPHVVAFKRDAKKGTDLGLTGLVLAYGLAFDHSGNFLVVDTNAPAVNVFAVGQTAASRAFAQIGQPTYLAFDKGLNDVYVADNNTDAVEVYAYPSGARVGTIPDITGAFVGGVAVSPAAKL